MSNHVESCCTPVQNCSNVHCTFAQNAFFFS
ncbi:MAG: hypothetical protein PWQ30_1376 [Euryarchaeota archaeon]|jgi:hypothetical protein|nr:hypothetical protein [Euryarchaeota archaeon]